MTKSSRLIRLSSLLATIALAGCGASGGPLAPPPAAATPADHPVTAELLADAKTVAPGGTFSVGLLLKMKPGWHVYWKNPGDAGLPTDFALTLPAGYSAGEVAWPVPIHFGADVAGYGYDDTVLLVRRVSVPATAKPGDRVEIAATGRWLTCEKVCIPGSAALKTSIAVAKSAERAEGALFDAWAARLPAPADAKDAPARVATAAGPAPDSRTITVQWTERPAAVEWYPGADPARTFDDVRVETEGTTTRITFAAHTLAGQKPAADVLDSLIVYTDSAGTRRGIEAPVALAPAAARP